MRVVAWAELGEHDRGQVVWHLWRRRFDGHVSAEQHAVPRFRHPELAGVSGAVACEVARGLARDVAVLPDPEWDRLYYLADPR